MFALPGFNPKSMSDDDLLAHSTDLIRKMNWAQRFAGAGQGLQQLSAMLTMIEDERRERLFMERWTMMEPYACQPIETDPDLAEAARRAAKDQRAPAEHAQARPRLLARRPFYPTPTPHPVIPGSAPRPAGPTRSAGPEAGHD